MAVYHWKGPGKIEEAELVRATRPQLTVPDAPDTSDEKRVYFYCTVQDCDGKFKLAALQAKHFNNAHSDMREDKDTWREFTQEVLE